MLREKILTPDQKFPFTSVFQCCTLDTECALSNKPLCLFEFSYGKISKLRCTNIIKDKSKFKWNTYMLSLHCPQQYFFMNWWEWLQYLIKCCFFFFYKRYQALSVLKCWKNSFALGQLLCKLVRQELILWCLLTLSPFSGDKNGFRPLYGKQMCIFHCMFRLFKHTRSHYFSHIIFPLELYLHCSSVHLHR